MYNQGPNNLILRCQRTPPKWHSGKANKGCEQTIQKKFLHAAENWPGTIHTCLWPYALRTANEVYNTIPNNADGTSPIKRFSGSEVAPQLKNHHTFGCPIYMLNPNLQDKKHVPRWESRARIGIYLGPSPRHARSVSLML